MKTEDVIFRAMARKITWWQAAEILGISDSAMLHRLAHYKKYGYKPNWQRGRSKFGLTPVRLEVAEKILTLYQEKYPGLDPSYFHRMLTEVHGLRVNGAWLEIALRGAGLLSSDSSNHPPNDGPVSVKKARPPHVRAR